MATPLKYAGLLLISSALASPAFAQAASADTASDAASAAPAQDEGGEAEAPDISLPGGDRKSVV